MLTAVGCQAVFLSADQGGRVEMLVEMNRTMRPIAPGSVGEWMVEPNPASLFGGSAPVGSRPVRSLATSAFILRRAQFSNGYARCR